jgi:phage terminase large subunit GpA-like protein
LDHLSYQVWAFEPNFTAYMIESGSFPDQKRAYYSRRNPPRKLRKLMPGLDAEATVTAAIDQFLHGAGNSGQRAIDDWPGIMHRTWHRADGVPMKIGSALIDANGEMRDAVVKAISRSPFSQTVRPSYGKGIGAKNAPISAWPQTREQRTVGPEWIYTKPVAGEVCGLIADVNYWKSRLHRALALAKGSQGAARLYKANPNEHRMTADHYTAEKAVEVTVGSRTVYEFSLKPNCDNEKLDNAVGAFVAASRGGIANIKRQPAAKDRKKRRTTYYG